MWGANAAAPLNATHFGYGLGAVLVNLLVRPFITRTIFSADVINNEAVNSTFSLFSTTKVNRNLITPYSITAILCFIIAVGHVFFYVPELKKQRLKSQAPQVILY